MTTAPPVYPSALTTITEHKPTTKGVNNPADLKVQQAASPGSTSSGTASDYSYALFPVSIPAGASVVSATLRIRTKGAWVGTTDLKVTRLTKSWSPTTITWNNRPDLSVTPGVGDTVTVTHAGTADLYVNLDVTDHVKNMIAGTANYGWKIHTSSTGQNTLRGKYTSSSSSGSTVYTPRLTIEYAFGPNKPTGLAPGTSVSPYSYISIGQPVLSATGTSLLQTGTSIDAVQVQLSNANTKNASGSFTSPVFDYTDPNATTPQLRLSTIVGAPTATEGNGYWWTMRVLATDGKWSPWADTVRYVKKAQGTLAITTPAAFPLDYVEDSTPPFSWLLTGKTQVKYQFLILDPAASNSVIYTSPVFPGAATVDHPPAGVISVNNKVYTFVIRTWDEFAVNRQDASTGLSISTDAPVYATASRDFTYKLTTSVTPVNSLTVTDGSPYPYITLAWQRTLEPDGHEIVRDGEIIATDLSSADTHKSGTSYYWIDYFPPSSIPHSYQVRAIVNSQTSSPTAFGVATNDTTLAWLADIDEDLYIPIAGGEPVVANLTEVGTTFNILGSKYDVRIVSSLRGYSGSVAGVLCGECLGDGVTTSAMLQDRLLAIRDVPGKRLHLSVGNIAVPVVIYEVSTAPKYGPEYNKVYTVAFNFHEVY